MANVSFQAPSDYQIEADEVARRRKYAEALQAQALQPMETKMAGGWAIPNSPLEGFGKLAQALVARKGQERATADQKALGERYNTERGAALAAALRAGQGAPASTEQIVDEQANGGEGAPATINAPAVAGSRAAMIAALTGSKFPDLQAAGLAQMLKEAEPYTLAAGAKRLGPNGQVLGENVKPPEGFSLNPGSVRFDSTGKQIAALPEKAPKDEGAWGDPYQMGGAWVQKNSLTGQVRQAVAREPVTQVHVPPPITAVQIVGPDGKEIVVDGRTGRKIGDSPKLSDRNKMEVKREFNMQGIGKTIKEAEDLLSGKSTGVQPTESGVGAAVDFAGRLVRKSFKGAKEAAALEVVGGALVSKMPRMEGPQSDRDTVLYKEMAGKVGDRTVPIAERQMALEKVKELWGKYENLNPTAFADRRAAGDDGPPPGAVRRLP